MAKSKRPVAYGAPRQVSADKALIEEVWRCAGHVKWLAERIGRWDLDPENAPLEAEKAVWLSQYQSERDRLVKAAKLAIDANVAQREVALAEKQAALIEGVLEQIFLGLQLTAEQRGRIPDVVPAALAELTSPQAAYQEATGFGTQPDLRAELERGSS